MSTQRQLKTTREQVVGAALRVADEVGVEGLTIRAVAAAAGAPPMSLYSHFAKKEQLLDLMFAQLSQELYPGLEHTTWQSALSAFCHNIRRLLLAHPHWTPLLSRAAPVVALPQREHLLALMTRTGITAERAMSILSSAGLLSLGFSMVEQSSRDHDGVSRIAKRFDNLRQHRDGAFAQENPVTYQALARSSSLDLSEKFQIVVDAFIAGLGLPTPAAS
jgi:AcrR family transcriptional regulator